MRKRSFREKFSYWFDALMAKGPISMIGLLFGITLIVSGVMGLISALVTGNPMGEQIWVSLMHTLDAGTITADSLDNIPYIILMVIATLCGLFITSVLISIITTGFENKLSQLEKGTSTVIDEGHTVILGFNAELFILLNSLIEANANHKNQCVVVVGDTEIAQMEEAVSARIRDFRTTKVLCRSGRLYEEHILARAGVENAASVIVNCQDDTLTIKVLLALTAYMKEHELLRPDLSVVAVINEEKYVHAARLAGGARTDVIFARDAISRIIAHTCNQSGLSAALQGIFDYNGDELYYETVPGMAGRTFRDVLHCFDKQVVFGTYNSRTGCHLNPPMDTVIADDDQLILLEEDDGVFEVSNTPFTADESAIADGTYHRTESADLLILGQNSKLNDILTEYDNYVPFGTKVRIVDCAELLMHRLSGYRNIQTQYICVENFDAETLQHLLDDLSGNVLILSDENLEAEAADSETLLKLIEIHTLKERLKLDIDITTEIQNSNNEKLADLIAAEDFVVGSNIVSLIAVQISQNRNVVPLFEELLRAEGSEMYIKPATLYVRPGIPVDFHTITEAAARRSEIAVGYRHADPVTGRKTIVTNPDKREKFIFTEKDSIIVIAEE